MTNGFERSSWGRKGVNVEEFDEFLLTVRLRMIHDLANDEVELEIGGIDGRHGGDDFGPLVVEDGEEFAKAGNMSVIVPLHKEGFAPGRAGGSLAEGGGVR